VIHVGDLTRALLFLDQLESFMGATYSLIGSTPYLLNTDKVEKQLQRAGGSLSRSQILQRNSRQIDADEMTKIMIHLQAMEKVQIEYVGKTTMYKLKGGGK